MGLVPADEELHVGPNAVLALAREGYAWRRVDVRHLRATFGFSGFRRFARANWRFGIDEMVRSEDQVVRDFFADSERLK